MTQASDQLVERLRRRANWTDELSPVMCDMLDEAADALEAAKGLAVALAETQWMLEDIVRSNSTHFRSVHERIIANRPALTAWNETQP